MPLHNIENLQREIWQTLTPNERLDALQQLENTLAQQDGCLPCQVSFISDSDYETAYDRPYVRGLHPPDSNNIYINEALVNPDMQYQVIYGDHNQSPVNANEPYMAVETLFHEDRHAHQEYVAQERPDLAVNADKLEEFQKNSGPAYLDPKTDGSAFYLMQPIEMDAREIARQSTHEFYIGHFGDLENYLQHNEKMAAEEDRNVERATDQLGENYREIARQEVFERYEAYQAQILAKAEGQSDKAPAESTSVAAGEAPSRAEPDQDYDYSQGYGY